MDLDELTSTQMNTLFYLHRVPDLQGNMNDYTDMVLVLVYQDNL